MKIREPELLEDYLIAEDLKHTIAPYIKEDTEVEGYKFIDQVIVDHKLDKVDFHQCIFQNCTFTECHFEKIYFLDVVFKHCNFSNIDMNDSTFKRVVFDACKLTGTNFSDGVIDHAHFTSCSAQYANLTNMKIENALFKDSDFSNAFMQGQHYKNVAYENCKLISTDFYKTKLKDIDLSSNMIAGIAVSDYELKGAIVNPLQACDLALLLGIKIKENI